MCHKKAKTHFTLKFIGTFMHMFSLPKQTMNFIFQICSHCTQGFMGKTFICGLEQLGHISYQEEKLDLINHSDNEVN